MIYFTSDLHFNHSKDFIYNPRGYSSIYEHNEDIIAKWNSIIKSEDVVYILGDLMLGDNFQGVLCLGRLNGKLKIIYGNHDTDARKKIYSGEWLNDCTDIEILGYSSMLNYKGYHFYLSHYPTLTSNLDNDKPLKSRVINLCGHSHTKDKFSDWDKGLIYHCELDAHNNYPVPIDIIIEDIKEKINES